MRSPRCVSLRTVPGARGLAPGERWLRAALPATASQDGGQRLPGGPGSTPAPRPGRRQHMASRAPETRPALPNAV